MKTSNSLLAIAGFAVVVGLVIWASFARENIPTESVFDAQTSEESEVRQVAQTETTPSEPFERTVRLLSEEAQAVSELPQPTGADPIAKAEQAIARADAAMLEAGLPAGSVERPLFDTDRRARLDALQARLDQLPR